MKQSPNRARCASGGVTRGEGTSGGVRRGHAVPLGGVGRVGGPPLPSLDVPLGFAGNDPRDYKKDRTSGWVISS